MSELGFSDEEINTIENIRARAMKRTQQERILELLRRRDNDFQTRWVTLPEILGLYIASYTRRIHELRKRGFVIEMRKDGYHSAYKLQSEPQ